MRPRILLTRRWPEEVEARLEERCDVAFHDDEAPMSADALRRALRDHDALCPTVTDALTADVLAAEPRRVRLIANYGVGYQHIDVEACRRLGVRVTNTPGILTEATANLAITLMLMVSRRAGEGERLLRAGRWTGWMPRQLVGRDLDGRLLGIVGFGRIGRAVAAKAAGAFGMRIGWHGRQPRASPEGFEAEFHADLDTLLAAADVISIHCPGGAETHHLIDRHRLALLKPGAILINTARGSVVDEAALAEALRDGAIAGAGLDVYEHEPELHPDLLGLENVVLLPHLGSATRGTRIAMGMRVLRNLDAFFAGLELPDAVV